MRRITIWFMSTVSALVLLFSYHTSTNASSKADTEIHSTTTGGSKTTTTPAAPTTTTTTTEPAPTTETSTTTTTSEPSTTTTRSTTTRPTTTTTTTMSSSTVDGDPVTMRYGVVQVQITVRNNKIVTARALQAPNANPKDQVINDRAVPILNQEAVNAQSAQIDMVSGASFTSQAYKQSLQAAIDKAHLS